MALPIDVNSIDALRDAREAMILFIDDARGALGAMESEIRRCVDWLTHDQRMHWQSEVKRRHNALDEAKAELHRKQLSQMHGENAHDSEQREAVRMAKRRLEEAEDKVELVHSMLPVLERAVMEYQTQARPFADLLEFDVQRSTEMLDRMIEALEEYRRESAPIARRSQSSGTAPANPVPPPVHNSKPPSSEQVEAKSDDSDTTPEED